MHESAIPDNGNSEASWALNSDVPPPREPAESAVPDGPAPDARGQCLLFCNRCGQTSDSASEFCHQCGAKRCVNCGD